MGNNKMLCKICGFEFTPDIIGKNHYIARDNIKSGLAITLSSTEEYKLSSKEEYKLYDAFDCPVCKCQNIIGERKRSNNVFDVEEKESNEENKPDCYGDYFDKLHCYGCKEETECIEKTKDKTEVDPISGETYGKPPKHANPVI